MEILYWVCFLLLIVYGGISFGGYAPAWGNSVILVIMLLFLGLKVMGNPLS